MNMNQIASGLYDALTESDERKPKPYDTKAEVLRVEGETVWVKIPGGIDETPVARTNNANAGDQVMVRISGGRAWLLGNQTNPATDDRVAIQAGESAGAAMERASNAALAAEEANFQAGRATVYANEAKDSAEIADTKAQEAIADAATADQKASEAIDSAADALDAAEAAEASATKAYYDLAEVENVIGAMNWIAQHGYMTACTETAIIQGKVYYTVTATVITTPTGNPSNNGYYELVNGKYVLSSDTEVDDEKTYYALDRYTVLEPTGNPSANNYYELVVDDAISQYIATHLAYTEQGLRLFSDNSSGYLLMNTSGIQILNANGEVVGEYGTGTVIGNQNGNHIRIDSSGITAWVGVESVSTNRVWYVNNNQLYIPKVVVVDSMQAGNWIWDAISNENHLTLRWSVLEA